MQQDSRFCSPGHPQVSAEHTVLGMGLLESQEMGNKTKTRVWFSTLIFMMSLKTQELNDPPFAHFTCKQ